MSLDPVQKYLMRANGKLTEFQSTDLTILSKESELAKKLLIELELAALAGDSFAATVCAAILRTNHPEPTTQLLAAFEAAAQEGDSFANAMCAKIARSKNLDSKDKQRAFEFAKYAAQSNFPPGIAELGYCYEDGRGTEKNLDLALTYLKQSAQLGYAVAACHLAIQYAVGQPYGSDSEKAIEYAMMAFNLGEAYAAYLLGTWYEEGVLIAKNMLLARDWYDKSARQGSGLGCIRMAAAYTLGELDLKRDLNKASEYHQLINDMSSA